ncbi:MAG TPA: hypothetical protein VGJ55_07260 [Pyrinomonadaceae bacterium]|jgi:hypothetical protein
MKTRDCRNTLREIDSNELDQQLSDKSSAHIAGCRSCREALHQGSSLRRLVAGFETVSAPPDFDMRLRARLAAEKKPATAWINLWRQAPGVPAFALALSLLVVGALAFYLRPPGTQQIAGRGKPAVQSPAQTGVPAKAFPSNELASGTQAVGVQTGRETDDASIPERERREPVSGARRTGRSTVEPDAVAKGSDISSREYNQLPANLIKRATDAGMETSPVVSLSAPAQPVVVSMRDDHGATRTISLPPVSFGSQRLVQPGYQSTAMISSAKGVW